MNPQAEFAFSLQRWCNSRVTEPMNITDMADRATPSPLWSSAFRRFLGAVVLTSIVNGTTRFAFVWAMGELTSWGPAIGLLGIMIGLPSLLTAPFVGGLADRFDRRWVAAGAAALMAVACAAVGAVLAADLVGPVGLGIAGLLVSIPVAAILPPIQAMVPSLVPPDRLMNGVAFQSLAMLSAMAGGLLVAGVVIRNFGTPVLFLLMAVIGLVSSAQLLTLPASAGDTGDQGQQPARGWTAIKEGLTYARADPIIPVLIGVAGVLGLGGAGAGLLIPRFAEKVLGSDALGAGAMNAAMAFGLIISASALASRPMVARPRRLVALVSIAIAGPGLIAIGSARTLPLAMIACLVWGLGGGIVTTLQRTVIQQRTAPEVMGRIMGLATMAQYGTFPLGALLVFLVIGPLGVANTMIAIGAAMFLVTLSLGSRLIALERIEAAPPKTTD